MSMYKVLIFILIFIKPLYCSKGGNDSNVVQNKRSEWNCTDGMNNSDYPRLYETYHDYLTRMSANGKTPSFSDKDFILLKQYCPNIGEIYDEYLIYRFKEFGITGCSKQEFTDIQNSYPTLIENKFEFFERVGLGSLGEDVFKSSEYYKGLYSLFPIFAETYEEYLLRMKSKTLVPMRLESFILYQAYYPNLCVQYIEFSYTINKYYQAIPRFRDLKLYLYPEKTYNLLKTKFPRPFENQAHFYNRLTENVKELHLIYDHSFAKRMYPKMSETYDEYCNRINHIFFPDSTTIMSEHIKYSCLKPMSYNMFVEYKKNYPQIQVSYSDIPFEKKDDNIPSNPVLNQINESTIENYSGDATVNIDYDAIFKPLIEQSLNYIRERNLIEVTMDVGEYLLLVQRFPNIYENYEIYRQRMYMIETDLLDEEDFADLKKIYIKQCEKYEDYVIRMKQIDINPTTTEIATKFKMIVPREFENGGDGQYYYLLRSDKYHDQKTCFIFGYFNKNLPFFLADGVESRQRVYYEIQLGYHYIKAFSYPSYRAFKYILPRPFEKYESYERRINQFRNNYDFSDYELEIDAQSTFKSFIQPLTKDEFLDLKLRFPKLSETPYDYENRLEIDYKIDVVIDDNEFHLFHLIKHSQIQPYDDYNNYYKRFKNLETNRRSFLKRFGIPLIEIEDFKLFKQYLPVSPYVVDYSTYTNDMNRKTEYMLDVNDYEDFMNVFPKYYDTVEEYSELMKKRYLDPVPDDCFKIIKKIQPHFLDKNFSEYSSRLLKYFNVARTFLNELVKCNVYEVSDSAEFDRIKNNIPRPLEHITSYRKRLPNVSMKSGDFERFKRIHPKISSNISEYSTLMKSFEIQRANDSFKMYKKQLPNVYDITEYDLYIEQLKNESDAYIMSKDEYKLWFLRLPKAPERYSNYRERMIVLKKNNPEVEPLEKHEFHDLKNMFSIPYETYEEHCSRLESYNLIPLPNNQLFTKEKAYRVLVGESYTSHVERILQLFNEPVDNNDFDVVKEKIVNDHGIETLIPKNFTEHVLSYPFNYETLKMFLSRQNNIKSDSEPDPLVKNKTWYERMKYLLPRINENIEIFKKRVNTYKLLFPEITEIQFNRHMYALPHPAESYTTFYLRTQYTIHDYKKPTEDTTSLEYPKYLKEYKELYDIFVAISPNVHIDYQAYYEKVKEYQRPLSKEEFFVFKQCLPKLEDSILEHNKTITQMGFAQIKEEHFIKLKIFYPRIYHISYDNYILDIELKYGKEANDYRGVIDALKLSRNEFTAYKKKFPKLFEFSYVTYQRLVGIKDMFTNEEFYSFRKANFPLPDENYEQHKSKMNSLDIDPIPYDVFCFFKGLYPDVFEKRYAYRIAKLHKELKCVNYEDDKYKLDVKNKIVSEIIERSKPRKELQNKVNYLCKQMMNSEEFTRLTSYFPAVFKPYSNFVDNWKRSKRPNEFMDEEMFKSFKKAYFVSINETYEEYKTRMKSLNLTAFSTNLFRYFKSTYPHLLKTYDSYKTDTKLYSIIELQNTNTYFTSEVVPETIGYHTLHSDDYSHFQDYFPRIFDSYNNYYVKFIFVDNEHNKNEVVNRDLMPIIFNHDEFDSIKIAYYPRLSETYDNYKARMISLGLWVLEYESFKSFKVVYPNPMTSEVYSKYTTVFNKINNRNDTSIIGTRHIMTEEEFGNDLKQDFPKLFESWEEFYKRRLIPSSKDKTNRLINDDGIFSKNLFNDMKIVYYPKLGQKFISFITANNSLEMPANTLGWKEYFKNVIKLYPIFFESFDNYEKRLEGMPLEYLKMDEQKFYTFYEIFPFPYEPYSRYKIRNAGATYKLSEEEFIHYRQVFPRISETYGAYKNRLTYELCIEFVNEEMFIIFSSWFPIIDDTYDAYISRVEEKLKKSEEDTKQQLSLLIKYMNTAAPTSKDAETSAKTSGAMNIETYGAMTYEQFKVFKLSLPIPNELREDYIIRINKLVSFAKHNDISEDLEPGILPSELFEDLQNCYPNAFEDRIDYMATVYKIKSHPVSINIYDELITVSKSMEKNRYTFDKISFYKIIVTSKNQLSLTPWPWYVSHLAKREMKIK